MNADQIRKIQEQVKRKTEKEKSEKENLIINIIKEIEEKYPERSKCLCHINNKWRVVNNNKLVDFEVQEIPHDVVELIYKTKDQSYYLMKDEIFSEQRKLFEWISKKYIRIRIAKLQPSLENMHTLGSILEEFQKEFPDKTMIDLVYLIKCFEEAIEKGIKV